MIKNKQPKVIVIVGPTTSHKTFLAIQIAKSCDGEIINADAYQVYKGMNIGTNGPTIQELKEAKFHLNEIIYLNETWDIYKFKQECEKSITDILNRNKVPIIVGGSNLYVDCIIKNYDLIPIGRSHEFDQWSNEQIYHELLLKDPISAFKIGLNNRKRLLRAIEVYSYSHNDHAIRATKKPLYDFLIIKCEYKDRITLYESINNKVDEMIKNGWVNEIKSLIHQYHDFDLYHSNAFKALGYREIYDHILNRSDLNLDFIKQKIRRYAKRQLTWINNKFNIDLIFNQNNLFEIINQVQLWLNKK